MKAIVLSIVLLLESGTALSQENGKGMKLVNYIVKLNGFEYKYTTFKNLGNEIEGLKIGRNYIQCSAGIQDSLFFVALGNPHDKRRCIYSNIGFSNKIFNQRIYGVKTGIWLDKDILGKIINMYFYNRNGRLEFKVFFQKNGYVKQILGYDNGELNRYSTWNYDQNGRLIGKTSAF